MEALDILRATAVEIRAQAGSGSRVVADASIHVADDGETVHLGIGVYRDSPDGLIAVIQLAGWAPPDEAVERAEKLATDARAWLAVGQSLGSEPTIRRTDAGCNCGMPGCPNGEAVA